MKNPSAVALGKMAKGKPKNYSAEEIERRSKILASINARKRKASKAKKRRMPNDEFRRTDPPLKRHQPPKGTTTAAGSSPQSKVFR